MHVAQPNSILIRYTRVDVESFESGKKKLRIQKYSETCIKRTSMGPSLVSA